MKYVIPKKKEDMLKRVGQISQIAGAKRYVLTDGRGSGTECVDVKTGTGFEYTVMPGRGMDIGWCGFEGMPISYISKVGVSAPSNFTGVADQWLRCFPGGMLSTCGLGNVGNFCDDMTEGLGAQSFGLHGTISNQCAKNVCVSETWKGDSFHIEVSGTDTEAQLRGESFSLHRTVASTLGENCLKITDIVTNEDFVERPYMLMYHVNFGYPLVDEGAHIFIRSGECFTDDPIAAAHARQAYHISAPVNAANEELFFYRAATGCADGFAAIVNEKIAAAVYMRYSADTLPYLTQWKMLGEADYVIGLEAGNCIPRGRAYHRERDMLKYLAPQASVTNEIELGIITGVENIREMIKKEDIQLNYAEEAL